MNKELIHRKRQRIIDELGVTPEEETLVNDVLDTLSQRHLPAMTTELKYSTIGRVHRLVSWIRHNNINPSNVEIYIGRNWDGPKIKCRFWVLLGGTTYRYHVYAVVK